MVVNLAQQDLPEIIKILQQIHDKKGDHIHVGEYLSLIFQNFPISIYWKSAASIMQGCNQHLVELLDRKAPEEMLGKHSYEYCWNELDARCYVEDDQEVIHTSKPKFNVISPVHHRNGQGALVCTTKMPFYNAAKHSMDIVGVTIPAGSSLASISNAKLFAFYESIKSRKSYYIHINEYIFRLTAKQAECLTYLSMGKTFKQIANLMDCSVRTIESHVALLKKKLNLYTTAALIDCFWKNPIKWF